MRLQESLTEVVVADHLSGSHIGRYLLVQWEGHTVPAPICSVEHTKDYTTVLRVAVPGGELELRVPFDEGVELVERAQRRFW